MLLFFATFWLTWTDLLASCIRPLFLLCLHALLFVALFVLSADSVTVRYDAKFTDPAFEAGESFLLLALKVLRLLALLCSDLVPEPCRLEKFAVEPPLLFAVELHRFTLLILLLSATLLSDSSDSWGRSGTSGVLLR